MTASRADDESDEELMLAYARGEATAFDRLYARHKGGVYRYVLRHCGNAATADELFQDIWMSVIRARATYAPTARFASWLYTLAHHRIVDHWRASGQAVLVPVDADDASHPALDAIPGACGNDPETQASRREAGRRLLAALAALPPPQRDAFLLQHESGLSLAEIAALTGVGAETIKSRLRYAIVRLRAALPELREGV
ncbi:MAG TPA: RNA polymerase sigma factor [Casimicrobiaceae bacterium]